MKKVLIFLFLFLTVVVVALLILWNQRSALVSRFLSSQLNVPVSIQQIDIAKNHADIIKLHIGNPPKSQTKTAFQSDLISISASLKGLRGDPLIIEEIHIQNILLGLESYNVSGTETNWTEILRPKIRKEKPAKRGWLVKKLTLNNLTVEQTKMDGKTTRYPTLQKLEFENISDETGFPIEEIEKAIFNTVLRSVFQNLGIDILKSLSPEKWFPDTIPFFRTKPGSLLQDPRFEKGEKELINDSEME
jgi:hypothetical protein